MMKVKVDARDLAKALSRAAKVAPKHPHMPVLSTVLLRAEDGKLYVTATDLELWVTTAIDADVEASGSVASNAVMLARYFRGSTGTVTLEHTDGAGLVMELLGTGRGTAPAVSADVWPLVPEIADDPEIVLDADAFGAMIRECAPVMAGSDARYYLSGAQLKTGPEGASLAATDGHRFVWGYRRECGCPEIIMLVSRQLLLAVEQAAKAVKEQGQLVTIARTDAHIGVKVSNVWFAAKVVTGNFPQYAALLVPNLHAERIVTSARALRSAVEPLIKGAQAQAPIVTLSATETGLNIAVKRNAVVDEMSGTASIPATSTGKVLWHVNSRYLMDCLRTMSQDALTIELTTAENVGVFYTDRETGVHLIMPIRV